MSLAIKKEVEKRIDPRVKRTRKLLEQAFLELMKERDFQSITIQDVADRATVNRATFYAHFEDKYDLLDSFMREQFNELLAQKIPPAPEFTLDRLYLLIATVLEFLSQTHAHCATTEKQVEPMLETAVQEELNEYLMGWFKQTPSAIVPPGADPKAAAMVWSWAIFGTGIQWAKGSRGVPADQIARQMVKVLLPNSK